MIIYFYLDFRGLKNFGLLKLFFEASCSRVVWIGRKQVEKPKVMNLNCGKYSPPVFWVQTYQALLFLSLPSLFLSKTVLFKIVYFHWPFYSFVLFSVQCFCWQFCLKILSARLRGLTWRHNFGAFVLCSIFIKPGIVFGIIIEIVLRNSAVSLEGLYAYFCKEFFCRFLGTHLPLEVCNISIDKVPNSPLDFVSGSFDPCFFLLL